MWSQNSHKKSFKPALLRGALIAGVLHKYVTGKLVDAKIN
jgi:hypothetical protein